MVGGVLEGNKKWDISGEVIKCISKVFPGVCPIRPEVSMRTNIRCYEIFAILWGLNILRLWTVWYVFSYDIEVQAFVLVVLDDE